MLLNLNDKLRVGVGEALEFVLVQIHDEEFIGWRELNCHLGELLVEVARVVAIFLKDKNKRWKRDMNVTTEIMFLTFSMPDCIDYD